VLAAEFVREKLLRLTSQELPHATAVITERWTETERGIVEIEATILVDRESQKAIVIGKGGETLKRVGIAVRRQLREGAYLELFVKVEKNWQRDAEAVQRLGY